uniref:Potassium channel tetramerisation-type BTB domain-containing protein n=1 Tax=Hyaloperonospora arabidopsidis (strain Emoy2) TaxID=559515 RepID=M4B2W4_HYAAE
MIQAKVKDEHGRDPVNTNVDLVSEIFIVCSDKDEDLTISIDWREDFVDMSRNEKNDIEGPAIRAKSLAIRSSTATTLPSLAARVPVLSRATSQGAYFNGYLQSLDPDHTVGRTRVPWDSKRGVEVRGPEVRPTRIVAFDVGGKLFRCKESLIAKYPLKRLNQIITCTCGKIGCLNDAFFIDRNPQHFEMILDWYRTGKLVRQRNVNEEAFKDDAIYFDLFEELFPETPTGDPSQSWSTTKTSSGLPARRRSVNDVDLGHSTTQRVSMFANMASVAPSPRKTTTADTNTTKDEQPEDVGLPRTVGHGPLRFFRRERRVLTPSSIPLVFMVRKFEQLLVESVTGRGKLMVRVCDETGMQAVIVPEAVLYDSHTRSYSKEARAQLRHNALLPGDHVYTFWIEKNASEASVQTSAPPALDIEFKLLFTFDPVDRLTSAMEVELTRATSVGDDAICPLTSERPPQQNKETNFVGPRLFMPPLPVQRDPESHRRQLL